MAMLSSKDFTPPTPEDPVESARVLHTRLRRAMLSGLWAHHIRERVRNRVGDERADAWKVDEPGGVDQSSCLLAHVATQLAVLYDNPPMWLHDSDVAAARMQEATSEAGWQSLMARFERDAIGLRENLICVEPVPGGGIVCRPVVPDLVEIVADRNEPDMPAIVKEWRCDYEVDGKRPWVREIVDVQAGTRTFEDTEGNDITEKIGRPWHPEWMDAGGNPIMPYVLYHASRTGYLWDPYFGIELVEGSLTCAQNLTFLQHCLSNGANPQRYMAGLRLADDIEVGTSGAQRRKVVADPAVVLQFSKDEDYEGQPLIGQFDPGADLEKMTDAVERYTRRVAAGAALSGDLMRVSGDPRSGYAVAMSREGQREASRKFEPEFRRSDRLVAKNIACILNRQGETPALPESGYDIAYAPLPLSQVERAALLDEIERAKALGLMNDVQAYARYHAVTELEARKALAANE